MQSLPATDTITTVVFISPHYTAPGLAQGATPPWYGYRQPVTTIGGANGNPQYVCGEVIKAKQHLTSDTSALPTCMILWFGLNVQCVDTVTPVLAPWNLLSLAAT